MLILCLPRPIPSYGVCTGHTGGSGTSNTYGVQLATTELVLVPAVILSFLYGKGRGLLAIASIITAVSLTGTPGFEQRQQPYSAYNSAARQVVRWWCGVVERSGGFSATDINDNQESSRNRHQPRLSRFNQCGRLQRHSPGSGQRLPGFK